MGFRRRLRAVALGAAAPVLVGLTGLAYLHVSILLPHLPPPAPPAPPQLSATDLDFILYDFITPSLGWATDTRTSQKSSWDRMTFIDRLHWWTMTGGDLWKTADGGRTWKDYGLQIDDWGYIPHALDTNHGWAQLLDTGPQRVAPERARDDC